MRTDMRKKIHFEDLDDKYMEAESQETVEDSTIWKKAKSAIQQLTPEKRMICLLHIAEDYSHAEIAQMIGITEGSSRIILHRAKQELRTLVSK
jgi:RNA polymerase sigma-70 factor (ECF subfamily)